METIILHSGGAVGADHEWARASLFADPRFIVEIHSFQGHSRDMDSLDASRVNLNIHFLDIMMTEAFPYVQEAARSLGRNLPRKPYVLNLLLRNFYQVNRSQYVFAVAPVSDNMRTVDGGTGWAVEMAKGFSLPILVFDQRREKWFFYVYPSKAFVPCHGDPPAGFVRSLGLSDITGIGSRDLSDIGRNAILSIL